MGRPKKEHAKTKGIRVRMTEDDFLAITNFAKQRRMTKSELMMAGVHALILREKMILRGADFDGFSNDLFEPKTGSWTP